MLPDLTGLLGLDALLQSDDILQILVKVSRTLPVLPQMIRTNVPWLVASLLTDLEHLILLVVVHEIVVGQLLD